MGVDTHMLLPRSATLRLRRQPEAYIDEHGVLQYEDYDFREPALADGDVRSILDRWGATVSDPEHAAYCLRLQLGDSVADDTGDARGVYLFPDSMTSEGRTYAEALQYLVARGCGQWLLPMSALEAKRYRPARADAVREAEGKAWTRAARFRPRG